MPDSSPTRHVEGEPQPRHARRYRQRAWSFWLSFPPLLQTPRRPFVVSWTRLHAGRFMPTQRPATGGCGGPRRRGGRHRQGVRRTRRGDRVYVRRGPLPISQAPTMGIPPHPNYWGRAVRLSPLCRRCESDEGECHGDDSFAGTDRQPDSPTAPIRTSRPASRPCWPEGRRASEGRRRGLGHSSTAGRNVAYPLNIIPCYGQCESCHDPSRYGTCRHNEG